MFAFVLRPSARIARHNCLLPFLVAGIILSGCAAGPSPASAVTQISTYPALEQGLYDGDETYADLALAGDFGIGTFDAMDGEMIALDGQYYQARSDGTVAPAAKTLETPFATVTFFKATQQLQPPGPIASYDQLKTYLDGAAAPANRPYAIRLHGRFPYIKIRSVPRQQEPYPPLADVVAQQVTWERKDIIGTLVGYWFPQYLSGLNAPGYHLHFISDDRLVAGHMLDCSVENATIGIDYLDRVTVRIPGSKPFATAHITAKP